MVYLFFSSLFVLGLAAGSFLNVLIWRYRPERSVFAAANIGGRSRCPYCFRTLGTFELIPIFSFLIQGGRCRNCRHLLSWQYPLLELSGGLIFLAVPIFLSRFYGLKNFLSNPLDAPPWFYGVALIWIVIFLIWLLIVAIDIKYYLVPNELNLILAILGIFFVLMIFFNKEATALFQASFLRHYSILFSPWQNIFLSHLLGALLGGIFFALFAFLSRGRAMGFGDVKLVLASGLLLGWPDIGLTTALAFIFGGLWGLILIISGKKNMRDKIPFAPFFVFGAMLTVFFGFQIVNFYFRLFQIS